MLPNKYLCNLVIGGLLTALALTSAAQAASTLSFGSLKDQADATLTPATIQTNNLLEGYWVPVNDPLDHASDLMKIANDSTQFNTSVPGATDTPTTANSKYFAYKLGDTYYFWRYSSESAPGATVYARLWSDNTKKYYVFKSFGNGWNTDTPASLSVAKGDWYKADKPYAPNITLFEESSSYPVGGTPTSSMKVYAAAGTGTDGKRQINSISWKWGTSSNALQDFTGTGATSNTITIPSNQITVGTTYYFQVTHTNWFGSSVSAIQSHTIGAGGVSGGPDSASYTFVKVTDSTGVNTFPLAYSSFTNPPVTNLKELIEAINAQVGNNEPVVTSIGWWDAAGQKAAGYIVDVDVAAKTIKNYIPTAGLPADPAGVTIPGTLPRDTDIQVSVHKVVNPAFNVTGTR